MVRRFRREPDDAHVFQETTTGSGIFGRWILDEAGLPAYRYDLDQYKDTRARYPNTDHLDRRDHWHQIGNDRVTALASNDGTVQVYLGDRGGVFLNRFEARDFETSGAGATRLSSQARLLNFLRDVIHMLARAFRRLFELRNRLETRRPSPPAPPVLTGGGRGGRAMILPRGVSAMEPLLTNLSAASTPLGGAQAAVGPSGSHDDLATLAARGQATHAYAGGFGYLDDGAEVWATAFRYRPSEAETRRVFGIGYFETAMTYRSIRTTRRVYAPYGDDPAILSDVRIENLGPTAVDLRYYEYWDVNVCQLKLQLLRSNPFSAAGDDERRELNKNFTLFCTRDDDGRALRIRQQPSSQAARPAGEVSEIDWEPGEVFLADLSERPPAAQYTDKATFFGEGGARLPDAVRERRAGEIGAPDGAPLDGSMPCWVLRHDVRLEPGQSTDLRFAYGAIRPGTTLAFLDKYRAGDPLAATLDTWKGCLARFTTGEDPALQREMAWHAYNLLSATVYHAFYQAHVVPQGSAYLYLHGADGAPRDQALFAVPLTYLRPELARETLCLIMRLAHADTGAMTYAFAGHGHHSDALGIHAAPSDLDLFFLLALSEYLAATGDMDFLDVEVPFYPPGARPAPHVGVTVLDHVRVAVKHLIESVGIGEHGLIRIGDGDWSDGIVFETAMRDGPLGVAFDNSKEHGESVPNTQMALVVLPLAASIVERRDPELADRMRGLLPGLRAALANQWTGHWYTRAVLRDALNRPVVVGDDFIDLESQPWALISGCAAEMGVEATLIESVKTLLDDPSPIGATLRERGMVWPAVSQLLTWGYTRSRPDLARRSLRRHTFAAHAQAFPEMWINIWSGPDGVHGAHADADNPGGAWFSPATPMTDFPVMNANPHAMALLGLLRVCGVEPSPLGDGLLIAPRGAPARFVLDVPLLRLEVAPGSITGEYRAVVDGNRVLHVRAPAEAIDIAAAVGGQPLRPIPQGALGIALPLSFRAGQAVAFEVRWSVGRRNPLRRRTREQAREPARRALSDYATTRLSD
jgi:hypothetical protein